MPEPIQPETDPTPGPGRGAFTRWAPVGLAAGAVGLGVFWPWWLAGALGALGWLAWGMVGEGRRAAAERAAARARDERFRADRAEHERLRRVIDAAGMPLIATDADGVITVASRAASRTLGGGRSIVGVRFDELFTQPELHEMERLARQGEAGRVRLDLPVEGERRALIAAADPLEGSGCVVTLRDVTELVAAAELKADFAANASHELRTPIASIRGAAETLQGPARDDPAMLARLTGMIADNAARLEALVNDLLDLSRLESGETPAVLEEVDLERALGRYREQFEAVCRRRRLTIEIDLGPGLGTVRTDPVLLDLIVRNLVENATKFAREGTPVVLWARAAEVPPDPVNPAPAGADLATGLRIEVRDEGLGIPLSQQQRIFERFYQVDRARAGGSAQRGTGLGLAIVKHAARRLGGSVTVRSVYQQGTTMIVELPGCVGPG